jgi:hypothetical protein
MPILMTSRYHLYFDAMKAHIDCFFISSAVYCWKNYLIKYGISYMFFRIRTVKTGPVILGVVMNEPFLSRFGCDEDLEY